MNTQKKNNTNKELLAELKERSKNKTVSQVAQETQVAQVEQKAQVTKVRNVVDFIAHKTDAELNDDSRVVIKERRAYMLDKLADNDNQVYNATMYKNDKNELALFTQKISDEKCLQYVQSLAKDTIFHSADIGKLLQTCGGAYRDKIRKSLFALSVFIKKSELVTSADYSAQVKEKNKYCIYYDISENNSQRVVYEFKKVI